MGGNITAWEVNHGEAQTTPPLLAVISALKARGVKRLAVSGYCFGGALFSASTPFYLAYILGLYTTRLIQNNTIAVGTMAHPASLNVPTDFDLVKAQSHVPIEINNAELDTGFTPALALVTDGVLGDGQFPPGYFRRQFDGVGHGFAVSHGNILTCLDG
jgi:dienelactone hydrolase